MTMYTEVWLEPGRRYRGCVHDSTKPDDQNPVFVSSSYGSWDEAHDVALRKLNAMQPPEERICDYGCTDAEYCEHPAPGWRYRSYLNEG